MNILEPSRRPMNRNALALLILVTVTGHAPAAHAADLNAQTLTISAADGAFQLSVPVSAIMLSIPRDSLKVDVAPERGSGSRQFQLFDPGTGRVISGWFEPGDSYPGLKSLWKAETSTWKQNGLPRPMNVTFAAVTDWEAVFYEMTLGGIQSTHLRAELSRQGTWIDIHISVTGSDSTEGARRTAEDLLRSLVVAEAATALSIDRSPGP